MGNSYQNLTHKMHAWMIKLAEAGEFDGHTAALLMMHVYVQHMAANDDPNGQFLAGEVLPGVIHPAVMARKTGIQPRTVRLANDWLHQQGFLWIEDDTESKKYRHIRSITIMTIDEASERNRKKMAGRHKRAEMTPRRGRRHLHSVPESVLSAQ